MMKEETKRINKAYGMKSKDVIDINNITREDESPNESVPNS